MARSSAWLLGASSAALATTLHSAPARADGFDFSNTSPSYGSGLNVGIFIGLAFEPKVSFAYGFDLRFWQRPAAFIRLEMRGLHLMELTAGGVVGVPYAVTELGWSVRTGSQDWGLGLSSGLHVGAGVGNLAEHLLLQATWPLFGDRANYDLSVGSMLVAPEFFRQAGTFHEHQVVFGRLIRQDRDLLLPPLLKDGAPAPVRTPASDARDALAARLLHDAQTEAASVSVFQQLAAELWAVGAPHTLVERAAAAASDEAQHATVFLERADRLTGDPLRPAHLRLPPRWTAPSPEALATLARETWEDGCLGEGASAAVLHAMSRGSDEQLGGMAQDEARHAELAWSVLEWLWQEGGDAARDAIASVETSAPSVAQEDSPGGDYLTSAQEARLDAQHRTEAQARLRRLKRG